MKRFLLGITIVVLMNGGLVLLLEFDIWIGFFVNLIGCGILGFTFETKPIPRIVL